MQQDQQDGPNAGECEAAAVADRVTAAVRAADEAFKNAGGSTQHYVRECLLPEMERSGLIVVSVPEGVKRDFPVTFGQAWGMMPPPYRAHMVAAIRYGREPGEREAQPFRKALEDVVSRLAQVRHMPEMMRGPALAVLAKDARAALLAGTATDPGPAPSEQAPS